MYLDSLANGAGHVQTAGPYTMEWLDALESQEALGMQITFGVCVLSIEIALSLIRRV